MANTIFQVETKAGEPIQAGGVRTIPFSKVVRLNIPGMPGGLVWNRPSSVIVMGAEGEELVIPVQDVTRQIQVAVILGGLLGALLVWLALRKR